MATNEQWLEVITHNLANVNTTGYKRDAIQFGEWMERALNAEGGTGQRVGQMGSGPEAKRQVTVMQAGAQTATGNPLDVAITSDRGLFAVDTGGGRIRFTRDGSFTLNDRGQLVTRDGYGVLDERMQPIFLDPAAQPVIDGAGNISPIQPQPDQPQAITKIGIFDGNFRKLGDSLWEGSKTRPVENAGVRQGFLETSNVNAVDSMVQMITVSRMYELAHKMVQTQDEGSSKLIDALKQGA